MDGSGTRRGPGQGATACRVPLGSKITWLILVQLGHGTLTAATACNPCLSPWPAHLSVTLMRAPQLQHVKSRSTFTSISSDLSGKRGPYHTARLARATRTHLPATV